MLSAANYYFDNHSTVIAAAAMGGKGQRRREKNYQAAHGGTARLPPAPNPKEIEALPSKLRKLMRLMDPSSAGPRQKPKDEGFSRPKGGAAAGDKKEKGSKPQDLGEEKKREDKPGKKRKRKEVNDLRFQELDAEAAPLSRKARKKEYLEARKLKHKKPKKDDIPSFPGHEKIAFGEVVEAPPKLSFPKKVPKSSIDPSQERVRLQAIEAYRDRRGWVSRPGVQLPSLSETLLS